MPHPVGMPAQPGNMQMHVWDAVHKAGDHVPAHKHVLQVAHHRNVRLGPLRCMSMLAALAHHFTA